MNEYSMYFLKNEFYNIIRNIGGEWNDSKERPVICLLKIDDTDIYYAIPVGNWNHRNQQAQQRILSYINSNPKSLRSNFYHVGNTTVKSIFFVSDVVPVTSNYIERDYLGYNNKIYTVMNTNLRNELVRKLKRILRQENLHPNYFRQHITDIKNYLQNEIQLKDKMLQNV